MKTATSRSFTLAEAGVQLDFGPGFHWGRDILSAE